MSTDFSTWSAEQQSSESGATEASTSTSSESNGAAVEDSGVPVADCESGSDLGGSFAGLILDVYPLEEAKALAAEYLWNPAVIEWLAEQGLEPADVEGLADVEADSSDDYDAALGTDRRSEEDDDDAEDEAEDEAEDATEEEDIEDVEARWRRMVTAARLVGYDVAADNLEYFLDGKGGTRKLPMEWLRACEPVVEGEIANQARCEEWLQEVSADLEYDATEEVQDYWDYRCIAHPPSELFFASGSSTVTSTGHATIRCDELTVHVGGGIHHHWWDIYDWHSGATAEIPGFGTVPDADGLRLQQEAGAEVFDMSADWDMNLTGSITGDGAGTVESQFTWSEA